MRRIWTTGFVTAAAILSVAADSLSEPDLARGLTIPELVAGLEAAGYNDFDSVRSDQRQIVVEADAPDGTPSVVKYWPETGRILATRQDAAGDGEAD